MKRSEQDGTARMICLLAISVLALGLCVWFVSERAGRNDVLLLEARLLSASRKVWNQTKTNATAELPSYNAGNRRGTVVLINQEVTIDGQKQIAELGWTNSCLGPGTLIVTSSNVFLWREPDGTTRKLNIPNLSRIPLWWYLVNP